MRKAFSRLPTTVSPVTYKVVTKLDFGNKLFKGTLDVSVLIKEAVSSVRLNSLGLQLSNCSLLCGEDSYMCTGYKYDEEAETVDLDFGKPVKTGEGSLRLEFEGALKKVLNGMYLADYETSDKRTVEVVATQFESTFARKAFPCWDEPSLKAFFDLSLIVPSEKVALSNMEAESVVDLPDAYKMVTYKRTPYMSTYLVAYVVGEFDHIEGKTSDGTVVRIYTPLGKKEQGRHALDVCLKTLPFYSEYFGAKYPLGKADLVAIPDFQAGAMENWGLITYRETALLVDAENSSASGKQRVALVVGHELAHQWFGNLVTMEWWTDLWLNEGFASWIEFLSVDLCFPSYNIWTQFVYSEFARAMELDALNTSHPIQVKVGHPSEIDEIFDAISYSKGSVVIRMLHDYLGDEKFRQGLRNYLNEYKYSNAKTEQLWDHLSEASGVEVDSLMKCWTKQMGYPVISVNRLSGGDNTTLEVKQEKFSLLGSVSEDVFHWIVPLTVYSSETSSSKRQFLLKDKSMTIQLENIGTPKWIKLNHEQVGFYRVNYSEEMMESLLKAFHEKGFGAKERLGFENDVFALSKAGYSCALNYLKLIENFSTEDDYTVWQNAVSNLGDLRCLIQEMDTDGELEAAFNALVCKTAKPLLEKLTWDGDGNDHLESLLRGLIVGCLGSCGDKDLITEAKKRLDKFKTHGENIDPNVRSAVYSCVLRDGSQSEFDFFKRKYESESLQEERVRILSCLGKCGDFEVAKSVLEYSLSSKVRSQDALYGFFSIQGSLKGRKEAWNFLKSNWKRICDMYSGGGFLLTNLVGRVTSKFCSGEAHDDVKEFFLANPSPAVARTVEQSLESIKINERWIAKQGAQVKNYLLKK